MHVVSSNTVSETIYNTFNLLQQKGIKQGGTRNGGATALFDANLVIKNPRSRHLSLVGRKSNIYQMIAETFWVMSGSSEISPYLSFFLPRAPQYSDDGQNWHGAYGPRIYGYNQFKDALNRFANEGLETRRSFIQIGFPEFDSDEAIAEAYGEGHKPKDIPCNREIHFYVDQGKFCSKVIQRSGDLLFGAGSINPFEFSFLQELMFNEVKNLYPEIELGRYSWSITNAHVYDAFADQVGDVLNYPKHEFPENDMRLIGPSIDLWQGFFGTVVNYITHIIQQEYQYGAQLKEEFAETSKELLQTFIDFNVPTENNILWHYVSLVLHYVVSKKMMALFNMSALDLQENGLALEYDFNVQLRNAGDLYKEVNESRFTNFVVRA